MSNDPPVSVQDPNLALAVELMPDVRAQIEQGLGDPEVAIADLGPIVGDSEVNVSWPR